MGMVNGQNGGLDGGAADREGENEEGEVEGDSAPAAFSVHYAPLFLSLRLSDWLAQNETKSFQEILHARKHKWAAAVCPERAAWML